MAFLTYEELKNLGFKKLGSNVLISSKASIYGASNISIGNNVRIDDFCLLSAVAGFIELGNHIHIAAYSSLFGGGGILMEDFSGLSSFVSIYSASDNYSGDYLIGPTMDKDLTNIIKYKTTIGKYATCGSHAVVLPGASLGEGSILGSQSLAIKPLNEWTIYSGSPAKILKERKKGLLDKARVMEERWK
jgi:acetyltransferase-like isoleucine patch superfamily enzyme